MMRIAASVFALLLLPACGDSSGGSPPPPYAFEAFQYPLPYRLGFRGINDDGDVVGYYQDTPDETSTHALLYEGGVFTVLTLANAVDDERAFGINASGVIAGSYANSGQIGFTLDAGVVTEVLYPGSLPTTLRGINDAGDVVGEFTDAGGVQRAFRRIGGVFSEITFPGAPPASARGINAAGTVVGYVQTDPLDPWIREGYVLSGGTSTAVVYPGAKSTMCGGINAAGDVVGVFIDAADRRRGFLLAGGVISELSYPGALNTFLTGINSAGVVVGEFDDGSGRSWAFIARPNR